MQLIENKDEAYMRSFRLLKNADVNEGEMKLSSSSSKYVSAFCRRKTIAIDIENLPDKNQESNPANKGTPTSSIVLNARSSVETKELMDHTSVDMVSSTEGEQLLCQEEITGSMDESITHIDNTYR